jgi:hypothetical protein
VAKKKAGKIHAILGRSRRTGRWRLGQKTSVITSLGACWLDLRQALLDGSPAKMTATVILGDLTIVVPPGIEVRPSGTSVLGSAWINVPLSSGKTKPMLIEFEWTTVFGRIRVASADEIEATNLKSRFRKQDRNQDSASAGSSGPVSGQIAGSDSPADDTLAPEATSADESAEPPKPPPAVGFEDLEPAPAVGFEDLEEEPPPAVGFEDLEPAPAVGFEDLEEEPPPAVGFEDLEEEPPKVAAMGFEDLETPAPDSPAGLDETASANDASASEDGEEDAEEQSEPAEPPPAVGFEDL